MIYDTGDIHANQYKWVEQIHPALSSGDILIVNGDFGIGFWNGRYFSKTNEFLEKNGMKGIDWEIR